MFDRTEEAAYGAQMEKINTCSQMKPRTKLERLHDMRRGLEVKLEEVNRAINLLQNNPQLTEIIDALEKVNV